MSIKQNCYQFRYKYGFDFRHNGFVWEFWVSHGILGVQSCGTCSLCVEILGTGSMVKKQHIHSKTTNTTSFIDMNVGTGQHRAKQTEVKRWRLLLALRGHTGLQSKAFCWGQSEWPVGVSHVATSDGIYPTALKYIVQFTTLAYGASYIPYK